MSERWGDPPATAVNELRAFVNRAGVWMDSKSRERAHKLIDALASIEEITMPKIEIDESKLPASPSAIAKLAATAALKGDHAGAEVLYMLAASRSEARAEDAFGSKAVADLRDDAKAWDRCAARERRIVAAKAGA